MTYFLNKFVFCKNSYFQSKKFLCKQHIICKKEYLKKNIFFFNIVLQKMNKHKYKNKRTVCFLLKKYYMV